MMKPTVFAAIAAVCLGLSTTQMATAGNGIQFGEQTQAGEIYIDCLGEMIAYEEVIRTQFHEFTTPYGTYHVIDSWKFYLTATGMTSGRQWYGILPWPFQGNIASGQVFQYVVRGMIRGVTPDTPNFSWTGDYKATINANGDLVVERGSELTATCRGKK